MIAIEQMRMRLPPGYQHRATSIARMVGDLLAKEQLEHSVPLDRIQVRLGKLQIHTPDIEIANSIVAQIVAQINGNRSGGGM